MEWKQHDGTILRDFESEYSYSTPSKTALQIGRNLKSFFVLDYSFVKSKYDTLAIFSSLFSSLYLIDALW